MGKSRTLICPECGSPFETSMPDAGGGVSSVPCGLRKCPSAGGGGKPTRTTAGGKAIDDRRAKSGAKRQTGGYIEQRSTGFGLLDAALGFGKNKRKRR